MKNRFFTLFCLAVSTIQTLLGQATWTAPTMDQFIGVNILVDRADFQKTALFKTVRVFHDWESDAGPVPNGQDVKCPLNPVGISYVSSKHKWSFSYNQNRALDLVKTYRMFNAAPVLNRLAPEYFGLQPGDGNLAWYRPVCDNNPMAQSYLPMYQQNIVNYPGNEVHVLPAQRFANPVDYLQFAKWGTLMAAQFGNVWFQPTSLMRTGFINWHIEQGTFRDLPTSSLRVKLKYMEAWNEADKFWKDYDIQYAAGNQVNPFETAKIEALQPIYACFRPKEYGALLSAFYDGHFNDPQFAIPNVQVGGQPRYLGIKNIDPGIKVVYTGLVDFRHNYVKNMIDQLYTGTNSRNANAPVPFDVLNFHHYCSTGGAVYDAGGNELGSPNDQFKFGYNFFGAGGANKGIHPEANEERLKDRVEKLIGALATTATSAEKTFDLAAKEIWVSEFGYDSDGDLTQTGVEVDANLSNEDMPYTHGQWLMRSFLELNAARSDGRGLDKAFVYKLNDDPGLGDGQFGHVGLLNAFNVPKKSWYFIRTLQNVLKDYTYKKQIAANFVDLNGNDPFANGGKLICYLFQKGTNETDKILVAWSGTASDFATTGTLLFNTVDYGGNDITSPDVTRTEVEIPNEFGKRSLVSLSILGTKYAINGGTPSLTISETPIFVKLGVNEADPKVDALTLAVSGACCDGVRIQWPLPVASQNIQYYRVYYRVHITTNTDLTLPMADFDLNEWTLHSEKLPASRTEIVVTGLTPALQYEFVVLPVGKNPATNSEVLQRDDLNIAVLAAGDCSAPAQASCLLQIGQDFTFTTAPVVQGSMQEMLTAGICDDLSQDPQNLGWLGHSSMSPNPNVVEITFNAAQKINTIYLFTWSRGRLKLDYFDECKKCWYALTSLDFYQNNGSQWVRLGAEVIPGVSIKRIRITRTGLIGTGGIPGNGQGFGVRKVLFCAEPMSCPGIIGAPGPVRGLRAENVETDAATLSWLTTQRSESEPGFGVFSDYEVRYSQTLDGSGNLLNPSEPETVSVALNAAQVVHRLAGLEPATIYHVEVSAIDKPLSDCLPTTPPAPTRSFITIQTDGAIGGGDRSKPAIFSSKPFNAITLSPNPTSDWLKIESLDFSFEKIEILDVSGRRRIQKTMQDASGTARLNVAELPPGLYWAKISRFGDQTPIVKPFVKI